MKQHPVLADLKEELGPVALSVQGNIPPWLSGILVRNGPVNISIHDESNSHWFDGLAMLHAFTFDQGSVSYANKFLRTEPYKIVFEKCSIHYEGFAVDPCRALFKRFFTWLAPKTNYLLPNANVNVAQIAQEYVALTEVPLPVRFDPVTLDTLGVLDYHDHLPKEKCWESAHPHRDKDRTINYLIQYGRTSYYTLYAIPDTSHERQIITQLPVEEPSYMHSFAMTENYIVFTEFPFVMQPLDLLTKGKAFIYNFAWKPERGTRFIVVNKHLGTVENIFHSKPFFAFHHANAYEKESSLYLDIICYDNPSVISNVADYFKKSSREHEAVDVRLERFTLSLQTGLLSSNVLLEAPIEFPRINSFFDGKPYRYLYLTDTRDRVSTTDLRPLYKFDIETQKVRTWSQKSCYPGEPVFVATPSATQEDEGVILSLILEPDRNSSFLLILDAQTLQEIGRAVIPHFIPPGLHGQFF